MLAGLGDKAPPIYRAGRLLITSRHDLQYTELSGEIITAKGHILKLAYYIYPPALNNPWVYTIYTPSLS